MNSIYISTRLCNLSFMTKLLMILLLMLFLDFTTHAQLVLSGGVVNRYAAVTAINAGSRTVTIGTESGAAHTWAIGDRVLLIQMTGNTAANGGKFEFATIESIAGVTLTISQLRNEIDHFRSEWIDNNFM